ncbi:MAG: 23S rRNA (guanosine(2251)-2'-O)-methyltransferase RlmB [Cyanobacteria bacterium P01_A01_bin.3]
MSAERPHRKSNQSRSNSSSSNSRKPNGQGSQRPKAKSRWGQGNCDRRRGEDRSPSRRRGPRNGGSTWERPQRRNASGANRTQRDGSQRDRSQPAAQDDRAVAQPVEDDYPDLLFGRHAVLAALEEGRTLNKIWVTPQVRYNAKFHNRLEKAKSKGAVIDEVPMQRLSSITNGGKHQGIAAQAAPFVYEDLQSLIETALAAKSAPLLVVADGIQDPHNLGAIARTTEAMGGHGLIVPQRRAVGVTSTVMKVAAGALESLPIAREVNLTRAIEALKEAGFWIYGTSTSGDKPLYSVEFSGPTAIVVGSEGKGLALRVENACDFLLSIPMAGKTESLNASVATGMILSEINRQRLQKTLELPQ